MKIELEIFKNILNKNFIWILVYIGLVSIFLLTTILVPNSVSLTNVKYLSIIGDPYYYKDGNTVTILLKLLQILLINYYTFQFNTYEYSYSLENFILRLNEKKWNIRKILMIIVTLVLFLFSFFLFIYIPFSHSFGYEIGFLTNSFIYIVFIILITITISNFLVNNTQSLFLIISLVFSYIGLIFFEPTIMIVLSAILFLINIFLFRMKSIVNKK